MNASTVLLVEADRDTRERIGDHLERAGMTVTACPGPTGPGYSCVGVRTGACPLAAGADVVVLDSVLDGDVMQEGASAHELVSLYGAMGLPMLLLVRPGDWTAHDAAVPSIRWPASEDEVVVAIRRLVAPGGRPGGAHEAVPLPVVLSSRTWRDEGPFRPAVTGHTLGATENAGGRP